MGMFNRCDHEWKEVSRNYMPPMYGATIERATERVVRELSRGVTTIELKCENCGDIKIKELLGKVGMN